MAPRTETTTITTTETRSKVDGDDAGVPAVDPIRGKPEPLEIIWINVFKILVIHLMALYGAYVAVTAAQWKTLLFTLFYVGCSGLSVTAGAHRLWSHRSYKAKLPLRTLLMLFNCMAGQNDIYDWVRDHRVHHKYSETDADPHNVNRGFFFAHVGWLMCRKHPEVTKKGKAIDCADVYNDPVVRFQMRYHIPMTILFCFIMPTMIPHRYWGEAKWNSFFVAAILRWVFQLNSTWLVNSAAHIWGQKPYDKAISPSENWLVSVLAIGEGFHNYHHTFPWDYSTSELGWRLNPSTMFIEAMEKIGWAYDLKKPTQEMIQQRVQRTGDGSHHSLHAHDH
ncbi:acyl-CoA Delta-9 desaturase [Ixodes scapularis]|uniref:acyl-CoA Delta-9 desaturase n=1 Tax=Ixodes scapularis TaxID=6945 RepID=UPI001A9DE6E4|nr:acyl-CoA Delta-9 desaturase [Ixodes scapularis]